MKIIVTNDDGINAIGIRILAKLAKRLGEVTIIAPKVEQSAKSHAINVRNGIEICKIEDFEGIPRFQVDSTPADCVRYAVYGMKMDFDIVFSGINNGYNMGEDIIYSGTVAGATEANNSNKKGIAFSTERNNQHLLEEHFDEIMKFIFDNGLLDVANILNVNVPENPKGIKVTHQGHTNFETTFDMEEDGLYHQRGCPDFGKDAQYLKSDITAIHNQYISISPLVFDRTDYEAFIEIEKISK